MTRFCLLALVGFSACAARVADEPSEADTTARTLAVEVCAHYQRCDPARLSRNYPSVARCEERKALDIAITLKSPNANAGPSWVNACLASLPTAACGDRLPDACQMPEGKGVVDASCYTSADCSSATSCTYRAVDATMPMCGTCRPKPADAIFVGEGEACGKSTYCREKLACTAGVCRAYARTGDPCSETQRCDFNVDQCVGGVCVAHQYAQPGEPCGTMAEGNVVDCAAGFSCSEGYKSVGRCVPPIADGQPCDPHSSVRCESPARCLKGVCTIPDVAVCEAAP